MSWLERISRSKREPTEKSVIDNLLQTGVLQDKKSNFTLVDMCWDLCDAAEPRLKRAIKDGAVILVNDLFLVKMNGRFAGLAVRPGRIVSMEVTPGEWFAPVDAKSKKEIRDAFDKGDTRVDLAEGEWTYISEAKDRSDILRSTLEAVSELDKMPDRLSKIGYHNQSQRRYYRDDHYEPID